MAKQVYIRFLRQGSVKTQAPENFDAMPPKEKLNWASDYLNGMSDAQLIQAMVDFEDTRYGYFDESPYASSIEEAEGDDIGVSIVETRGWKEFCEGTGQEIVED